MNHTPLRHRQLTVVAAYPRTIMRTAGINPRFHGGEGCRPEGTSRARLLNRACGNHGGRTLHDLYTAELVTIHDPNGTHPQGAGPIELTVNGKSLLRQWDHHHGVIDLDVRHNTPLTSYPR